MVGYTGRQDDISAVPAEEQRKEAACEFWKQHLGKNVVDLPILESSRSISILNSKSGERAQGKTGESKYETASAGRGTER